MKTPIIVGFDPGLTVGLAILDLNGNLLFLKSFKEIPKSEIITTLMEYGKTILIAADVENPPKAVKKLASSLNAKIFSPKNDISVSYKNEIVNEFLKNENDISFSSNNNFNNNPIISNNFNNASVDAHERDSLSAAILAYNSYKKKLNQLEKKFLEAKIGLNSIDKEHIINENYYAILNQAKSFLINDNPISSSIAMAFEMYNLVGSESDNLVGSENKIPIKDSVSDIRNNLGNNSNNFNNNNNNNNNFDNNLYNDSGNGSNENNNEDLYLLEEKLDKLKNINKSQEKQIKNLDKILENIKNKNNSLSQELNEKNEKLLKIKKELKESKLKESKAILKDKEVNSKIKLLKSIQNKYKEEKELRKSLEEKLNKRLKIDDFNELSIFTPIKIIDSFTKNGLNEANRLFKLKRGDVIYLASSKGGGSQTAKFLTDLGIKAIINNKNEEIPSQAEDVFEKENIPIFSENDLDIKFFDDYAVADSKVLEEKINQWKFESKEKIAKKAQDNLLNVINEYRVERKREL
ncbi:DUF460 domain-containing protein [Methanobrevibacter sp. TMH8]|uniref:DUF460 domain-containing protein n=1 Tax=Methanobrevibacter sp. TMH8 TaxID=2848611 RepID=UPI001CCCAD6C|nr:DUF460 domain-containing protein [Methanobrevibacter sp. TMH8]MBZ9571480.1 DUF460 domain-containing protein [Methanobrevibacter sp. TMH8]